MWITDLVLLVVFFIVLYSFWTSESFKSDWGGVETIWHNDLRVRYSGAIGDKLHVFNPAAYNK